MEKTKRDGYLQRLFKGELEDESKQKIKMVACMVEQLAYPILVASHIKPWKDSNEYEMFDPSNGLLLTRNMDTLFDYGYISFENDGKIILSDSLHRSIRDYLGRMKIRNEFLSSERSRYLSYHRKNVLRSRQNMRK